MYIRIYWKSFIWGLMMMVLFLVPLNKIPGGPELPFADKAVHVFLFLVFSFLLLLARIQHVGTGSILLKQAIRVLIISILFGAIVELSQSWMALGREGSVYDLFADFVGSLLGWFSVFLFRTIFL